MKIADIASYIKRGITPSYVEEEGFTVYNQKCIRNGFLSDQEARKTSLEKNYPEEKFLKYHDILINSTGAGTLGRVTLFKGQRRDNCLVDSHISILRCHKYEARFLSLYLRSKENYIETLGQGATNQLELSIASIKNIDIPDIPLASQKKIADILSAYDDLIENNQKQIKLLEEAAQRLYKEWFIDLHFPGHEFTHITDGIPQGWEKKEFTQVFDFVRGKSYTSQELSEQNGVLMVNLKNIRAWGGYKRKAEKRFIGQYKETQTLSAGDVVMSVTDMTQERRLVGHVAMIPNFNEPATFSMDLIKLIPYEISKNYLYATLQYGEYGKEISALANGTNVLHLKPEAMMKMTMLIPTNNIMSAFEQIFEPIRKEIESLQNQCELAIEARDRLLPKLMNGEIEAPMKKKATIKVDGFENIRNHWRNTPYDKDLPLAARSTGDISEETLEKLKEIAEEE